MKPFSRQLALPFQARAALPAAAAARADAAPRGLRAIAVAPPRATPDPSTRLPRVLLSLETPA